MAEEQPPVQLSAQELKEEALEAIKQEMAEMRAAEDLTPGMSLKLDAIERRIAQIEQDIKFRGEGGISVTGNIIALDTTHIGSGGPAQDPIRCLVTNIDEDGNLLGVAFANLNGVLLSEFDFQ